MALLSSASVETLSRRRRHTSTFGVILGRFDFPCTCRNLQIFGGP
jgi:hypothetical protein